MCVYGKSLSLHIDVFFVFCRLSSYPDAACERVMLERESEERKDGKIYCLWTQFYQSSLISKAPQLSYLSVYPKDTGEKGLPERKDTIVLHVVIHVASKICI